MTTTERQSTPADHPVPAEWPVPPDHPVPADHSGGAESLSDAALITAVRAGNAGAYGTLYRRHAAAARRLASQVMRHAADADDVVAETFARVLRTIRRGGGPTVAFRPYLLTAIRRVASDQLRGQRAQIPTDDLPDPGQPFVDPAVAELERSLITRAFLSLPERWTAVLWHTEIEQARLAEVAVLLGLTPNGVAALRYRAREGLRQAYLQMHLSGIGREECRPVASRLGAHVRGALPRRATRRVDAHLRECDDCRAAYAELASINGSLRGLLAPVFLGGAAAAYLSGAGSHAAATAAGSAAAAASGTAAGSSTGTSSSTGAGSTGTGSTGAGSATGGSTGGSGTGAGATSAAGAGGHAANAASAARTGLSWLRYAALHRPGMSAAAGVLLAAAAIPVATLTHSHRPPHGAAGSGVSALRHPPGTGVSGRNSPASPGSPLTVPSASATPARAGSPTPAPTPTPAGSPTPPATPTPVASSPLLTARLGVTVNVTGLLGLGLTAIVDVRVADPGQAATGGLNASLTLPSGIKLLGLASGSQPGWTCVVTAAGANCAHGPVAAGAATTAEVQILLVSLSGCGNPVLATVTSGTLSASGQSGSVQC